MINDILAVIWKEFHELPYVRTGMRGGRLGLLVFAAVFGIFLPLQTGRDWVESPISLVYWAWVPFLLVSGVIADSIAGERERHTLETLLASRLSDSAILFGKIGASIAYGWGLTLGCVLVGLVTVNIAHGQGQLLIYPPLIGLGVILTSFLISGLASGLGVLVSLRSPTVRQAQQTFSFAYLLLLIPLFAFPVLPAEWQFRVIQALQGTDFTTLAAVALGIVAVLDIGLVAAGLARFKRARLLLD